MKWLDGKKTYIGFIALALLSLADTQGWIAPGTADTLYPLVIGWTGVSGALKVDKAIKAAKGK